jgi:hypothetical protein
MVGQLGHGMFKRLCGFSIAFALLPTAASAWTVGHFKDRMTDRQETFATVSAGQGTLYVGCMNGKVFPRLTFPQRIGVLEVGATYRFDEGAMVPRIARLSQDGRDVWIWPLDGPQVAEKMRRAKRLRIRILHEVMDFDLASGQRLPEIRCK